MVTVVVEEREERVVLMARLATFSGSTDALGNRDARQGCFVGRAGFQLQLESTTAVL